TADGARFCSRMDRCRFFRHQSFTAANARANRLLAVICRTMGLPFRDRPQTISMPCDTATASALITEGIDVLTISRRIGHASPVVTLGIYGHLFSETDRS